jgi:glyoxylase-like metal-dependent hydrolase (beta-lactamase superfamily II)
MSASLELLSGIENADADAIQKSAGIAEPGDIHINCYLIRGRGRVILVDAGAGPSAQCRGQLNVNLAAIGVSPDDVDTVLLTHCHPDHIGGLLILKNSRF